jgi:Ribonuclease G/E
MTDASQICATCYGTGEIGNEVGVARCPDCGGEGYMPASEVLVEWRSRDIERAHTTSTSGVRDDIAWLAAELRKARSSLLSIYTLASDAEDSEVISRIRFEANRALGIHPIVETAQK